MTVPYIFANAVGNIPLSELDANFANVSNYSNTAGNVVNSAQANITSVGTLISLSVSGNVTGNYFLGNGSQLTGLPATYGNANVVANIAALGSNPVSTTGNITGGKSGIGSAVLVNAIQTIGSNITGSSTSYGIYNAPVIQSDVTNTAHYNYALPSVAANVTISNIRGYYVAATAWGANSTVATQAGFSVGSDLGVTSAAATNYAFQSLVNIGNATANNYAFYAGGTANSYFNGNIAATKDVSVTGNSVTGGTASVTGITFLKNTVYYGANSIQNIAADDTTLYLRGTAFAFQNAGASLTKAQIDTNGNILTGGIVSAAGNITGNYILGNGSFLTGVGVSSFGNANVVANVAALGSNPVSTTGNITGNVGTFTTHNGTTFSASGNITGGNVLFGSGVVSGTGNVSGNVGTFTTHNGTTFSASGNITGGNVLFGFGVVSGTGNITGNIGTFTTHNGTTFSASGNITGGNLSVGTGSVSAGNLFNNNANGVGNIGTSLTYFNTVFAKATSAQYADLAENYLADAPYLPGTVVSIGGDAEVTQSSVDADGTVIGVVSTSPAYHMNAGLAGGHVVAVALTGRVPCRVTGTVKRGSAMVSNGDGTARSEESPKAGTIIGKALTSFNDNTGVIEVVIGRF